MARSDVSNLAQETTAAIVLFFGKLHTLACLSLAWKGTVCRVKRTVIDSFLASDLDLSFIPTQRSVDNVRTRLARLVHQVQFSKLTSFWFEAQFACYWFFQEGYRCVDDFAKNCWEMLPMPCAYLNVFGNDGGRVIRPERFYNKGLIIGRDMGCQFLRKTMAEVLQTLLLLSSEEKDLSSDSVCGCDCMGGCQFDSEPFHHDVVAM